MLDQREYYNGAYNFTEIKVGEMIYQGRSEVDEDIATGPFRITGIKLLPQNHTAARLREMCDNNGIKYKKSWNKAKLYNALYTMKDE